MVGTEVFTEQLESTMGLCLLRFPSGEETTQCMSSGCPLLRCPFIPVTKIGLEICMGGVGNRRDCSCDLALVSKVSKTYGLKGMSKTDEVCHS